TDPAYIPTELRLPHVTFKDRLPAEAVPAMMRNYDAIALPVSFESSLRNMSEFNIATKMSECLASGTLTLVIAPTYAVMARLLEEKKAAVVVTEKSTDAIVSAVSRIGDPVCRQQILTAASEFVTGSLTPEAMRRTWEEGTLFLRRPA